MDGHPGWITLLAFGCILFGGPILYLIIHAFMALGNGDEYEFPVPLPWDGRNKARPAKAAPSPQMVINPRVPWWWTLLAWGAGGALFEAAWHFVRGRLG